MSWANPLALLGATLIAIPIIVHLLGRHRSRIQRFPTLRFLQGSPLVASRRRRISDPLLLVLRCAIVVLAAMALAQPLFRSTPTGDTATLARVVIVDTSASMLPVRDPSTRLADSLAASATTALIVRTASPSMALTGASQWLEARAGLGEIAIISDFQIGTLDSLSVETIPASIGVTLRQLRRPERAEGPAAPRLVSISRAGAQLTASWQPSSSPDDIVLLTAPSDRPAVDAAKEAADKLAASDVPLPIAIVYSSHEQRDALRRSSTAMSASWMADAFARIRADPLVLAAGSVVADAAAADVDGKRRLVIFTNAAPGSIASAALIAAARRAGPSTPTSELEFGAIPAEALAKWERAAKMSAAPQRRGTEGPSDARWLWLAALGLIAVETWVRRAT